MRRSPIVLLLCLLLLFICAACVGRQGTDEWFINTAWPLAQKDARAYGVTVEKEDASVLRYAAGDYAEAVFRETGGVRSLAVPFRRAEDGRWHTLDANAVVFTDPTRWLGVEPDPGVRDSYPQEVLLFAQSYAQEQLEYVQNELGLQVVSARLTGLTPMGSGLAGLTEGRDLYRLEYRFRLADPETAVLPEGMRLEWDELTEWTDRGQPYLLLRWEAGELSDTWTLVCATDTEEIETKCGTPQMLAHYGNVWLAACVELYIASLPPAPSEPPLEVLAGLKPEEVGAVRCHFCSSTAAGQTFTLTREQEPELVEQLFDLFSRDPRNYKTREGRFQDYSCSFSVTYLDRGGYELVTVYEHDTNTVSFGDELYWTNFINTDPFNLAYSAAKELGTVQYPRPYVSASSGGVTVGTLYHERWAETWNGEFWLSADGIPVEATLEQYRDLFDRYTLNREGPVTLTFSDEVLHENTRLRIYDENYQLVAMDTGDPEAVLNALGPGTWWCSVSVTVEGVYIRSQQRCEKTGYECFFRLVVE